MRVAVSGYNGFIGRNLCRQLELMRYTVEQIPRSSLQGPVSELAEALNGAKAVLNMAGSPVITRWSRKNKKEIYNSRILSIRNLVEALRLIPSKPDIFITVSAVGIYEYDEYHDETSKRMANDFLGNIVRDWEEAASKCAEMGIRTVIFRLGVVLGKDGGAFPRMVLPFRLGLGGPLGNGEQAFSFVHIEDVMNAFMFALENKNVYGIYNVVAPDYINGKDMAKAIGDCLKRPAFLRIPEWMLGIVYGKGATVLTKGRYVIPKRLLEEGFVFKYDTIEKTLKSLL